MRPSNLQWKNRLGDRVPEPLSSEIDVFENEIALRKQGKIEDRIFAETRLRRGAYGQRYDNGQRSDGKTTRTLNYPDVPTKGPNTLWDAPGMQRIKIPFGGLNAPSWRCWPICARNTRTASPTSPPARMSSSISSILKTRPALMRRLASVGITTREACGNSVRNVTACPIAGVCREQTFDVTPYAKAITYFMLGHPDAQSFGRKFKIAFSGCKENACALVRLHDFGAIAVTREERRQDSARIRAVGRRRPRSRAAAGAPLRRIRSRRRNSADRAGHCPRLRAAGEKKNRNTARLKFLVSKLGIEEFKKLVAAEREILPYDPRWTDYLKDVADYTEEPLKPPSLLQIGAASSRRLRAVACATNVYRQRQQGYATVTIALPLGDITATQLRVLADVVAQVYERDDPQHGGTESGAALGERSRSAGALRRTEAGRSGHAGRGHDRRCFLLPRHGYLQARHRFLARARGRTAHAPGGEKRRDWTKPSAASASRSAAASTPAASTMSRISAFTA